MIPNNASNPRTSFSFISMLARAGFLCLFSATLHAQAPPALPSIRFENFAPEIRQHVRKTFSETKARPRDAAAIGRLGMTLHTYEEYESAAACYERARHFAPGDFRWVYYRGIALAALGKHAEGAVTFKEALRRQPDHLPSQLRLADALLAAGQTAESQPHYEAIVKQNPAIAQAHYGLGRIKIRNGDSAAGVEHLRKAIEVVPEYGMAHYALGLALRDLGQTANAQEHLALSQTHKLTRPALPDPLLDAIAELNAAGAERLKRGVMLESAGKIEASIAEHERALEINPNLVQAHINLISLHGRSRQPDKAEKHYLAAVALNPNLSDSHYNYGVLLVGQERYAEAEQAFLRSLQLNPLHAEAHHNYATLIEGQGRLDEAATHYRKVLESRPGHRMARFHLGRILVNQDKLAEAIGHFLQILTPEDENTPRFTYALGATYARAGEKQKALQTLRKAHEKAVALGQTELATSIERDLRRLTGS